MNSLVHIGAGSLVCMMPLALYLLFLAFLHQRHHPTLVSGVWDFYCALLGLAGCILVGGVVWLGLFDSSWRLILFRGNFAGLRAALHADPQTWSLLSIGYITLLGIAIGLTLRSRRLTTVIYNIDPNTAQEVLVGVLESQRLVHSRLGNAFTIRGRALGDEEGELTPPTKEITGSVRLEPFLSMNLVTLRWKGASADLRAEIEGELEKAFQTIEATESGVGGWFLTAAVSIFFVMLVWMAYLIYVIVSGPR